MRYRVPFLSVVLGLMMVFGLVTPGHAQGPRDPFVLQPGGSATITFESFCLDYGLLFPPSVGTPQAMSVEPNVVGALNYAIDKGYMNSQPEQVQLAIWHARGAPGVPALDATGQEITSNLNVQPAAPAGATSLVDAMQNNQVSVTLQSFGNTGQKLSFVDDYFQGRGELKVENASGNPITLYVPVGTYLPASGQGYQNMIAYAAGIQVIAPEQAATNTPEAPTNTPEAPTNTPMPATATPLPATATPLPTNTPAPTDTVAPTSTSGAPTVTPAQQTLPTPTSTGAASGEGFEITPTSQPAPVGGEQVMPDTGVRLQQFRMSQVISAIVLGLDVVVLGFVLRRRARR